MARTFVWGCMLGDLGDKPCGFSRLSVSLPVCRKVGLAVPGDDSPQEAEKHNAKSDEIPVSRDDSQRLWRAHRNPWPAGLDTGYDDQKQQDECDDGVSLERREVEGRHDLPLRHLRVSECGAVHERRCLRLVLPS